MTHTTDPAVPTQTQGVSRRILIKGAAWSVPIVATAIAVPMAAASTPVQTECVTAVNAEFAYETAPVTAPHASMPYPSDPSRPLHQYLLGQSYEMTSTTTITYTGALPSKISDLSFDVGGTNWFIWSLAGTPTLSSTRGNMTVGTFEEHSVATPELRRGMTTIYPIAVGSDDLVHPGDVLTLTWNLTAHGPSSPMPSGSSGYAYTFTSLTSCAGGTGFAPAASAAPVFYQYVA
ncbi:hypothetical protein ACWIBQ_04515 [Microbacterium keratanolyticum]